MSDRPATIGLPQGAVAVIGMAGRFPGARDVRQFWDNLCVGREGVRFFSAEELDPSIPAALRADPAYVPAKGIVEDCDKFDAAFFGVPPLEAQIMDPQQRIALELAWSALEDAGHPPASFPGLVGVYVGMNWNRYREVCLAAHPEVVTRFGAFNAALANEADFLATRLAYKLNLRGPAVTVSTACSTSLVAIAQACQALLNRDCDLALAGGASISVPVQAGYLAQEGSMLSADGHCRPFDAQSSGTTFNDGAGIVVLRRLEDAVRDGDCIRAVVRGFAVNNDGADKVSFTAPSVGGQADVVRSALEFAGVDPATIGLLEAHGTATPLGDPIEVAALKQVFAGAHARGARCALGSVKSSVGHLVHAAGVAGFIKAVLAVQHGKIPANLHFTAPNPRLGLEDSPFYVNAQLVEWPAADHPRRAGVSAFGVGGTNAHVVLEQPPPAAAAAASGPRLLCLSAKTEEALDRQTDALQEHLAAADGLGSLASLAFTLQCGREPMPQRAAWAVSTLTDARRALGSQRSAIRGLAAQPRGVALMFTGQGAQRARMGAALYAENAVYRQHFDHGASLLRARTGLDLLQILREGSDVDQTRIAQPALFLLEHSLAKALESEGIEATVLLGHSLGEFVAATLAGVFSLADGLHAVAARGEAMQALPRGSMLAVHARESEVQAFLSAEVSLAAVNAPELCVLSGPEAAMTTLEARLASSGLTSKKLRTSHAFHSAMMEPAVAAVRGLFAGMPLSAPQRAIISTVTGREMSAQEATNPEYWARQLREPVRFAAALDCLAERGACVALEVGPGSMLTTLALQHPRAEHLAAAAVLPGSGLAAGAALEVLHAVAHCWTQGGSVNWHQAWSAGRPGRAALPSYPFARTRYWLDPAPCAAAPAAVAPPATAPAAIAPIPEAPAAEGAADLQSRIQRVIEDTTGVDVTGADPRASFLELGLDSLSLTQIALQLKNTFQVGVTFRQLMERTNSLASLAEFLAGATRAPAAVGDAAAPAGPAATGEEEGAAGAARYDVKKAFGAIVRIHTSPIHGLTERQRSRLDAFMRQYVARTRRSKEFTQQHRPHLADPRVVNGFRPLLKEIIYQLVIERSQGSRMWDLDGNEYVDVLSGFGMNLLGWQPACVVDAVRRQLDAGYEIGPQHPLAGEVARMVCEMTGFDRAGLCNTGSEAVMGAIRIARTVTGRGTIAIFTGSYHGIFDEVIVRGTKKLRAFPAAPGIMPSTAQNVLVLDYGTPESLEILRSRAGELAAVLVEPVQSRRPDFQPREYLHALRDLTQKSGSLLIFDEVVTGFRSHPGGIQALFGLRADICTYGKVVGGGFPIGVIAGRREFMDALDGGAWQYGDDSIPTVGVTYFAGTFVRHPLALAAAHAVLTHLQAAGPSLQADLNRATAALAADLNAFCRDTGAPIEIKSFASVWRVAFTEDHPLQDLLFAMMRNRGIHILDNFPCFLTTAHSAADLALVATAFKAAVRELQESDFLPRRLSVAAAAFDAARPPVPGARLGKDADGRPAWFVPNPDAPGKYLRCPA